MSGINARLAFFILTSLVAGTMTFLRWKYIWKKKSLLSLGGVGFFLSFSIYSALELLGRLPYQFREFLFAVMFAISWGFVATAVSGKKLNCYMVTVAEILTLSAISFFIFGMDGLLFGAIISMAFVSNFNHIFKGLLPRFTLFAVLVDVLIYASIIRLLMLVTGRPLSPAIDAISGFLSLSCAVTYFVIAKPAVISGKLQADSVKDAFKI